MEIEKIYELMKKALIEARKCGSDVPVGALVVREGQVIASAFNQREEKNDPLGHAELLAISRAATELNSWRLSGCTLICTLEPCPMCAEAILQARIQTLVFGAYDPLSGACGSRYNLFADRKALAPPQVIRGILEEECSSVLKEFFRNQRQKKNSQ